MHLRPIAFYLPQFHPIPENDAWWGKGFTEWNNVVKAKPLFKKHYQPHLPADLGFYDLRLPEIREQQANLAKEYGIYGFCYYHYWFNGRRILERPFQEVYESGKPDLPFMLCWANENWTRAWDGEGKNILLEQNHSIEDDKLHIQRLLPYFIDRRYITVNGKPVFAVYKSALLPDASRTIEIWRKEAKKKGIELFLCHVENFGYYGLDYLKVGFDAAIEFQPFTYSLDEFRNKVIAPQLHQNLMMRSFLKFFRTTGNAKQADKINHNLFSRIDYNEYVDFVINSYKYPENYLRFPGVTPSWDNTARRGYSGFLFKNANPDKYGEWLNFHCKNFSPSSKEENFIFINAWNEWAEGNHLEPCVKWGRAYLEATKRCIEK